MILRVERQFHDGQMLGAGKFVNLYFGNEAVSAPNEQHLSLPNIQSALEYSNSI